MAAALSYETLQKQIAESELGQEWVQDALMRQDVWLLTDLGYSQSECEIRRLYKLYFQNFSLPWLKLLAKLTARARARERHSLDWVHRQVRSLYQLENFMRERGYFQPEDLSNELLQQFIVGPNGHNHRYSVAYAIQLWKEEGWLNLPFIPPKRNRKTPEIKSIPEEVLHQSYEELKQLLKVSTPLGECHRPTMLGDCQYRYSCLNCSHHRVTTEDLPKLEDDFNRLSQDLLLAEEAGKQRRMTEIKRLLKLIKDRLQGLNELQKLPEE